MANDTYKAPAQDPPPAPGWVKNSDGGWVPPDHPLAQTAAPASPAPAAPAAAPPAAPPAAAPAPAPAPSAAPQPAAAQPAVQPPTPKVPKPGPDWVPTQDGYGWVPPNHPLAWKPPVNAAPAPVAAPAGPPPETTESVFRQKLIDMMKSDPTNVSNDPALRAQIDAYGAQAQFARRQRQEASAERLSAQGLGSSGTADSEVAQSYEDMGHDTASYAANATLQEITARRDELKNALTLAGDRLNNEEKNALERQLAELDAQIKREGITSQERLGEGDLALRSRLGDQQTSLGLLQALMSNDQFGKDLGFRIGNAEAGYNRDALLALMRNS